MIKYEIGDSITVLQGLDGITYVTRPSMISNKIHTVPFDVDAVDLANWMIARAEGNQPPLVQDAFPQLTPDEREFILTGITAEEWRTNIAVADDE